MLITYLFDHFSSNRFMSLFKKLDSPLLTKRDEEYQMLLEVAEEYINLKTEKSKNGTATETVIREHLLRRGFNLSFNPNVKLEGSEIKNDLFLLKSTVNPSQKEYAPNDLCMIIEIKNNSSPNQSEAIKANFDELKTLAPYMCFAAVILSDKKGYSHEITKEKLGYPTFTLVSRKVDPKVGGLYSVQAVTELLKAKAMKKTGDWDKFIAYIKTT